MFSVAILLLLSCKSLAAITVTDVTGAYSGKAITTSSVTIYQSTVGNDCSGTGDTDVCNNCSTTSPNIGDAACATRYAANDSFFYINFTSTEAGTLRVTNTSETNLDLNGSNTSVAANTPHQVKIEWQDIADYVYSGDAGTLRLYVGSNYVAISVKRETTSGVDSDCTNNPYGVCDFRTFNGDQKGFLELDIVDNYPSNSGTVDFAGVRVFYKEITAADVVNCPARDSTAACGMPTFTYSNTSSYVDLDIDSNRSFEDAIAGLENDKNYCLVVLNRDTAGNLGYKVNAGVTNSIKCLSVAPSEVVGLLTKTNNCFIATAAYGSPFHGKVKVFREFRDKFLIPTKWGRHFVKWYYSVSPEWAKKIEKNENAKFVIRLALWPLWLMSWLALHAWPAILILPLLLGLSLLIRHKRHSATLGMILLLLLPSSRLFAQESDDLGDSDQPPQEAPFISPEEEPKKEAPSKPSQAVSESPIGKGSSEDEIEQKIEAIQSEVEIEQSRIQQDNAKISKLEAELKSLQHQQRLKRHRLTSKKEQILKLQSRERLLRNPPRVTKKTGEIFYPRNESPQNHAASFRVGRYSPADLYNSETTLYFDDVYTDSSGLIIYFDYEYQFFKTFGRLGAKVGTGLFMTSGKGRFKSNISEEAREQFTFVMLPNTLGGIYRMQLWDKQPFVPFAEAGVGYFTFVEVRNDFKRTKYGGSAVGYWAAGGSLLLDKLSPSTIGELDADYGINHMWLTAEYRSIIGGGALDFSADSISGGILFEF